MHRQRISKVYFSLIHWRDFRLKVFWEGILIGLLAGAVVVLFRYLLEQAEIYRTLLYQFFQEDHFFFGGAWFLVLLAIAYILGWLVKREPMASGSGIPQVKGILLGLMKMQWLSVLIHKLVGGVLAIGSGLSLGREGPSIQLGAAVGQGISRMLGRTKMEQHYLMTSGASAGLAAAFNAPLAGVMFSFEELHKNFSSAVLMTVVAAAVTADVVTQHFFGFSPVFTFAGLPVFPTAFYGWIVLLGILMGLFSILFNYCLIKSLDLYERTGLSIKKKAAIPLLIAGILGFFLPQVLGGGNQLVNALSMGRMGVNMLFILLAVKFLFTMISYGSGVPGGIFLPMLVLGALAGDLYGQVLSSLGLFQIGYNGNFIVLAMAAYFSAIVKAPITGSVLIMEMTGSFEHMLSLIVVSMAAYVVADICKGKPVYEALLNRSLRKQGKDSSVMGQKRMVVEAVIASGALIERKEVKDVNWPDKALLVSIKRGEQELVPQGDTRMLAGDYIYVLVGVDKADEIRLLAGDNI
ncbi:MAG: H(+)/Cl(-) exchange transporter ClcA [Pelosinus sp.]|nr:H(+)/Cl(-) exchange transporter ClcA [Pelosinus sp.]